MMTTPDHSMTFKEFQRWCNDRACDGCWGMTTAMICIDIMHQMHRTPFWRRKKRWNEEFNHNNSLYSEIVAPTNKLIEEWDADEETETEDGESETQA